MCLFEGKQSIAVRETNLQAHVVLQVYNERHLLLVLLCFILSRLCESIHVCFFYLFFFFENVFIYFFPLFNFNSRGFLK